MAVRVRDRGRPATARAGEERAALTIRRLGDLVGDKSLRLLHAPLGVDSPIGPVRIHGADDSDVLSPGTCVLAVGTPFPTASAELLMDRAERALVGGVVFSLDITWQKNSVPLQRALAPRRLAVFGKPSSMSWSRLLEELTSAEGAWPGPMDANASHASGVSLFDLCDTMDQLVDATVIIEAPIGRVAAYSSSGRDLASSEVETILHRRIPAAIEDCLKREGVFAKLTRECGPIEVRLPGQSIRTGVGLRVRNRNWGVLWAFSGSRQLDPVQQQALAGMASVVQAELLRQLWYEEDQQIAPMAAGLRMLLEGRLIHSKAVEEVGLHDGSTYAVVGFALDGERFEAFDRSRLSNIVTLSCQASRRPCFVVALDATLYAIIGVRPNQQRLLKALVEEICMRMDSSTGKARAAIGSCVERLSDIARSRRESDRVLRVLSLSPAHPRVATIDDLRNELLLNEVMEAVDSAHAENARIPAILTEDGRSGMALVDALWAYILAQGNAPVAAQQLGIPVNTFRYRLRRLREVSGLRLDDPDERLAIELELRWLMRSRGDLADRLLDVYRAFASRNQDSSRGLPETARRQLTEARREFVQVTRP